MTPEQQAIVSMTSLVRIIAKHLNISETAFIDQVAHRVFAGTGEVDRPDLIATPPAPIPVVGTCRRCGCTDADCSDCIRLTGVACSWVEPDLCSACVELMKEV